MSQTNQMTPVDLESLTQLSQLLANADTSDVYRAAVSTGTIFRALGILREVFGLVAADHDENRAALVDVLCAWCTALRTRPRPRPGLLDRVATIAVASFLLDVAEVRGTFKEEKMRETVDAVRTHVACLAGLAGLSGLSSSGLSGLSSSGLSGLASNRPRRICFCRVRGCERNEHFVRYALSYAGTSPDGCEMCPVRPLHYALGTKNDFMVRELVARGADVNATGPGLSTSMHWAATEEHMLLVLKAGFKPSAMVAVTNGGTVWEYHAKRGTAAQLRAAVARSKSHSKSHSKENSKDHSKEHSKEHSKDLGSAPKRRRVSIEVVPRDELWAPW